MAVRQKNPTALAVLHFLISRMHRGTNGVVMSYAAMAQVMGIADRTAKTAIAALAEANFVQILQIRQIERLHHQFASGLAGGARSPFCRL